MKSSILWCLRQYQRIMGFFRAAQVPGFAYTTCKFHPTCSEYAALALDRYGAWRGSIKSIQRILRCNPMSVGGVDYP